MKLPARGALRWSWELGAAVIAVLYGALKAYWALGGEGLRFTIGFPDRVWDDPWFVAFGLWGTVLLSALAAVIPYALDRDWGRSIPRWMLLPPVWIGCVFTVLRGVLGIVQDLLYFAGLISVDFPDLTKEQSDRVIAWSLFLYSPWFLTWGIFLGVIGWRARRRSAGTDVLHRGHRKLSS